jgi:hypothetical protein
MHSHLTVSLLALLASVGPGMEIVLCPETSNRDGVVENEDIQELPLIKSATFCEGRD